MRLHLFILVSTTIGLLSAGCQRQPDLGDANNQTSYALGQQVGTTLVRQEIKIDEPSFLLGLRDALSKTPSKLDDKTIAEASMRAQQQAMKKQAELQSKAGEFLTASEAYLAENKKKSEVKTTASGLQYEVMTMGKGAKPKDDQMVEVHYVGKLADGTIFDSSIERKRTATFNINQVVPGWTEALKLMPVGSKWIVTIPPSLGYGAPGAPPRIPPNSVLIFEIELISVSNSPAPPKNP